LGADQEYFLVGGKSMMEIPGKGFARRKAWRALKGIASFV